MPLDEVESVIESGSSVDFVEGFENANFFFQTRKEVFSHREMRQAVYYAINTQRLIDEKMNGHAGPVTCVLADNNKDYHEASTIYTYNRDKARQLIASTGLRDIQINFLADKNC